MISKKLKTLHDRNEIFIYLRTLSIKSIPYLRRFIRLLALPYCYFFLVNWKECTSSKVQVLKDLLYIFFKLKYFPDNYSACRLWEKDRKEWSFYYGSGYDPYQKRNLSRHVQRPEYFILFEDKEVCQQLCEATGLRIPKLLGIIDPQEDYRGKIREIFKSTDVRKMIIKSISGAGGRGISLGVVDGNSIIIKSGPRDLELKDFVLEERSVVQEVVIQDDALAQVFPYSANTLRVITMLTSANDVVILGALLRFGVGKTYIDNTSSGGVAIGVDKNTGFLKKAANDKYGNQYTFHPTTNFRFEGFQVPQWKEVIEFSIKTQKCFPYYRLLGLDIAVTREGPVLIEINAAPDIVGIEQSAGPLFRDRQIWSEFKKYDLFINGLQKTLY